MTLEQRQARLREEVAALVDHIVSLRSACPSSEVDPPFLLHLEQQCQEKTRELEALNALAASAKYKLWNASRAILWLIWIMAAALLVFAAAMASALGPGYQIIFGCAALLTAAWALWATIPPSA